MSKEFGYRLEVLRESKQWTQEDLGKKAKINGKQISHYETGVTEPGVKNLKKLAKVFDTTLEELIK